MRGTRAERLVVVMTICESRMSEGAVSSGTTTGSTSNGINLVSSAKPFSISKRDVWNAYLRVKTNRIAPTRLSPRGHSSSCKFRVTGFLLGRIGWFGFRRGSSDGSVPRLASARHGSGGPGSRSPSHAAARAKSGSRRGAFLAAVCDDERPPRDDDSHRARAESLLGAHPRGGNTGGDGNGESGTVR
jgi:hypothetical protein